MRVAIIKKLDKKSGTVYVYDSVSYWDKEKKQPRSKRKLIGKLDPVTGEIVPTGNRGRRPRTENNSVPNPAASEGALSEDETQILTSEVPLSSDLPAPNDLSKEDIWSMYTDCKRRILETEAALAKAESTIASLELEKKQNLDNLEHLLNSMKH